MEPVISYYSSFDEWGRLDREPGDEACRQLNRMLLEAAEDPSILGASSHLLYIGRRT
ncbi:hypothetical protein ACFOLF_12450 [Paenibacillus sepulcri]|uniref:Uncharacterized protein n=1 Tax=Paenibacillus sepulcri TaxID=359917 RepID=A0ABS7CA20_9BACL|nr:hypothetical protein [Paenibacillus sepulcri]